MKYSVFRRKLIFEKYGEGIAGFGPPELWAQRKNLKQVASLLQTTTYYIRPRVGRGWCVADRFYHYKIDRNG
jgi:hypothetical protein